MKRYKGNITQIKNIETYLLNNTTHIDNSNSDSDSLSKAFVKQYNIYLHTEGNELIQLFTELIPTAIIKVCYDYRNNTGEVKIDTRGFNIIYRELPNLMNMLRSLNEYPVRGNRMSKLHKISTG